MATLRTIIKTVIVSQIINFLLPKRMGKAFNIEHLIFTVFLLLIAFFPSISMAADYFGQKFCAMADLLKSTGYSLKILALIIFGIALLLNKGSWGQALLHLTGGAAIFGAGYIVASLGANNASCP